MRKLLIADDEPGVRALVRMTLLDERYEIVEAVDGPHALELVRTERPDMVLLDIMMPGMTGIDVCRRLKSDPATADVIVVMLTAQARSADIQTGMDAGADAYFTKPFSPLALLRKVDEVFAGATAAT